MGRGGDEGRDMTDDLSDILCMGGDFAAWDLVPAISSIP